MSDVSSQSRLFAGIAPADVHAMCASAAVRHWSAGEIITAEGTAASHLFLMTSGRARFFASTPGGKKMLLFWLAPGDIVGAAALLPEPTLYRVSSETVEESETMSWDRRTIRDLAARQPRLTDNLLAIACEYFDWYLAAHTALSSQTAGQRLAGVLVSLAPVLGRAVPGGVELDVTNEELGSAPPVPPLSAAHVTPFTASRLLNEWQRRRTVIKRRGKIVLLAPKRLTALTS